MSVALGLSDDDRRLLEAGFRIVRGQPLALAVSGGPDSMALLHLAVVLGLASCPQNAPGSPARFPGDDGRPARAGSLRPVPDWIHTPYEAPPAVVVLTVDHGLRPGANAEARLVAVEAARLGLPHQTLTWTGAKPQTGIAAAAREARYRLIDDLLEGEADHYAARGDPFFVAGGKRVLVTAHHQDDQAETMLMRLARGSGIDGLAAMAPLSWWGPATGDPGAAPGRGLEIARPLLDIPKSMLERIVAAGAIPHVLDPTNADDGYERVRIRRALTTLDAIGVSPSAIAMSARRLRRARAGLAPAFEALLGEVQWNDGIVAEIDGLLEASDDIALRVLAEMHARMGGAARAPSLSQIETLHAQLRDHHLRREPFRATLGGAAIALVPRSGQTADRDAIRIVREAGRFAPPDLDLEPGRGGIWDCRYWFEASVAVTHRVSVRPLGRQRFRDLAGRIPMLATWPALADAAETTPAVFCGSALTAVPLYDTLGNGIGPGFRSLSGLSSGLVFARFLMPDQEDDHPRGSWWPRG